MFGLRVKEGVQFKLTKAGGRIICALDFACRELKMDLTVTCGSDGHPPEDPHTLGEAFDIRTHDIDSDATKQALIRVIMSYLRDGSTDVVTPTSIGLATTHFYAQLEFPNLDNEHIHIQRRKGTVYL